MNLFKRSFNRIKEHLAPSASKKTVETPLKQEKESIAKMTSTRIRKRFRKERKVAKVFIKPKISYYKAPLTSISADQKLLEHGFTRSVADCDSANDAFGNNIKIRTNSIPIPIHPLSNLLAKNTYI